MSRFIQSFEKQVSELGTVKIRHITLDELIEADKRAKQVQGENESATTFFNYLLECMLKEPILSSDKVANLSPETLEEVVDLAVDALGVRDYFRNLPTNTPIRVRLYQAHLEQEKALSEKMQRLLIDVAEKAQRAVSDVTKNLIRDDILQPYSDMVRNMGLLDLKIAMPTISADIISPYIKQAEQARHMLEEFSQATRAPLQDLVETISRIKLPDPYYSTALLESGLHSSDIHTPSYDFPETEIIEDIADQPVEERIRQRLLECYDIYSKLEQSLRDVIESKLSNFYGPKWWKQNAPQDVRNDCEIRKQEKETGFAQSYHPIYYAYVHDYRKVIVRRDNWDSVFAEIFHNKQEIEVCFNWVGAVRDSVAHVRPISDEEHMKFITAAKFLQTRIDNAS